MIPTALHERPWQKVATDLLDHNGKTYIIAVDYYSRFFEVAPLNGTTSYIFKICRRKAFYPSQEQPSLPAEQQRGKESSSDCQKLVKKSEDP